MKKRRHAFTLVEMMVVAAIAIPCLAFLWNAYVGSRRAEKGATAMAAAVRGASIFERYLRQDIASLDLSAGTDACSVSTATGEILLKVAFCGPGTLTKKEDIIYSLRPLDTKSELKAFSVHRNGSRVKSVCVERIRSEIWNLSGSLVLQIDFACLDPGFRRNSKGEPYRYETSILTSLPWAPVSKTLVDYSQSPPR